MTKTLLDVPYKSQLDNVNNPFGSCNVTSIAMALEYLGVKPSGDRQLEDELYEYCQSKGYDYQSAEDLAQVVRDYGRNDRFEIGGDIESIQDWLQQGNPAVIHGYFTDYGHIVTVVGFDENGFFVHDPYGEWFEVGYRTDLPGASLHYSYDLIRRACMHDGNLWTHFISAEAED